MTRGHKPRVSNEHLGPLTGHAGRDTLGMTVGVVFYSDRAISLSVGVFCVPDRFGEMLMPPAYSDPPDIALASLSIRNFRGIESLDLDFRGPDALPNRLVVLAGPNGSGKTAVLEAGLIAAGGQKLVVGRHGKKAIRKGNEDYKIEADFWSEGMKFKAVINSSDMTFKPGDNAKSPFRPPLVPFWYFSSWRAPDLVGPVGVTVGRPGRRPAKNDQNRLLNVKQLLTNAAAIERFSPGQKRFLADFTRWIDQINTYWQMFNSDSGGSFVVDLTESDAPGRGAFDVFLNAKDGSRQDVDVLSAGQLELFLFLSSLVLNNDRKGIVFIDEPELHLDPQWHALIVQSLMQLQPHAQFIVATHSPEIYDAAMSYERHFLVSPDDPRARIWNLVEAGA